MDIKGILLVEKASLLRKLKKVNEELMTLPAGRITFVRNGKHWRWIVRVPDQHGGTARMRLPKRERRQAAALVKRRYLEENKKRMEEQVRLIYQFFEKYPALLRYPDMLEEPCPDYRHLLMETMGKGAEALREWARGPYKSNADRQEQRIFKTRSGVMVRSKSEMIIADKLHDRGMSFRYEEEIVIAGVSLHSDFKIPLDESLNSFLIWEHCGMMDDPAYFRMVLERVRLYHEAGYSFEKGNLIFTFESRAHPLDPQLVDIIMACFL